MKSGGPMWTAASSKSDRKFLLRASLAYVHKRHEASRDKAGHLPPIGLSRRGMVFAFCSLDDLMLCRVVPFYVFLELFWSQSQCHPLPMPVTIEVQKSERRKEVLKTLMGRLPDSVPLKQR